MNNILKLYLAEANRYCSVFLNNHGRIIYLDIVRTGEYIEIVECKYLDRTKTTIPQLWVTRTCEVGELTHVIETEFDKSFVGVDFCDDVIVSSDYVVSTFFGDRKKKILIMIADGKVLRTILKNRYHRAILLELTLDDNNIATITQCRYVDKRAKGKHITPQGLITVRFNFSFSKLLEVANYELEGGFTDAIITREHTIVLDRPICGSI